MDGGSSSSYSRLFLRLLVSLVKTTSRNSFWTIDRWSSSRSTSWVKLAVHCSKSVCLVWTRTIAGPFEPRSLLTPGRLRTKFTSSWGSVFPTSTGKSGHFAPPNESAGSSDACCSEAQNTKVKPSKMLVLDSSGVKNDGSLRGTGSPEGGGTCRIASGQLRSKSCSSKLCSGVSPSSSVPGLDAA